MPVGSVDPTAPDVADLLAHGERLTWSGDVLADPDPAPWTWLGVDHGDGPVAVLGGQVVGRSFRIDVLVERRAGDAASELVDAVRGFPVVTAVVVGNESPAARRFDGWGFRRLIVELTPEGVELAHRELWGPGFAASFDDDVAGYEAARPGYPDELYEHLVVAGLTADAEVLEIGAGPGSATLPLLDRGARITAVEPGANMAARLRTRTAGRACAVIESTFEQADLSGPFDLAVSATAFHWVDPHVGLPKLAGLLAPGGTFAAWWNIHGAAEGTDPVNDAWEAALEVVLARHQPGHPRRGARPYAFDVDARRADLAGGGFTLVDHHRFTWPWHHTTASVRALFASFSDWSTLPEPQRTAALDAIAALVDERFGGQLTLTYSTALYVARPTTR